MTKPSPGGATNVPGEGLGDAKMLPHITHKLDGSATLTFPYHRGLVDCLKMTIPASSRTYDLDTKAWTVAPPYAGPALRLMRRVFGYVAESGQTAHAAPPDPIRQTDRDYAVLHLLPSAPPSLVEAAFRCLSKDLHPDRGGPHEAMVRLNAAVTALRERQGVAP